MTDLPDDTRAMRLELAKADYAAIQNVTMHFFQWILTTLLIVNAGGLATIAGSDELRHLILRAPSWCFAGGTLAALFGGLSLVSGLAQYGKDAFRTLWDNDIAELSYDQYVDGAKTSISVHVGSALFGLSLLGFIAGCVLIGIGSPMK